VRVIAVYRSRLHKRPGLGDFTSLRDAALDQDQVSERGVLTASDELWETAVRQASVISRLTATDPAGVTAVDEAALELALSRRQVYVLPARWRTGGGVVSDLLPGHPTSPAAGVGRTR
jgi:putative transposase